MSAEETIVQQVVDAAVVNSEKIIDVVTEAVTTEAIETTIAENIAEVVKETTASTLNEVALQKYKEYFGFFEPFFVKVTKALNSALPMSYIAGKYLRAVDQLQSTPVYKWLSAKVPFPNYTVPEW